MSKDITLLILAAGMGSRFGGLKQIEPMGPNDEFIIDYSVYDAIKAGFNKIVFIIKKENYELFKETIGKRIEPHIKVEYAFQELSNIPEGYSIPEDRIKPLGTAHAVWCAKNYINEPFAMINADDFYGRDAFNRAHNYLNSIDSESSNFGMIGYRVANTLTENGSVKRGVCEVDGNNYLVNIIESKIEKNDGVITASPLDGRDSFEVKENDTVSMNFLLFTPKIFEYIEEGFDNFFNQNKDDIDKCEYLIPEVISNLIHQGRASMKVLETTASWHGVTYKEDTPDVKRAIKNLVDNGEYKNNLWS